jgi:hypothetical protein
VSARCGHRTDDPRGCPLVVEVAVSGERMRGYRPSRWRLTGQAECPAGHLVVVEREHFPASGAIGNPVSGGLPGLGRRH